MKRRLTLAILTLGLGALAWAALTPMAFWMGSSQYQYRDARVVAYSTAASDFEVQAECSYLASVDTYAWGLNPDLTGRYATEPMILFGAVQGAILAHKFTPRAGLTEPIQWVPIPAPSMSVNGRTVTLTWEAPALEAGTVDHWELLVNGVAELAISPTQKTLSPGPYTFAIRAVLVGQPQLHLATGTLAKVTIK